MRKWFVILLLSITFPVLAQNKVYQHDEATLAYLPASQAEDTIFELDSLASGAGIQSAHRDLSTSARAATYAWRCFVQFATAPVLDETVDFYIKSSGDDAAATTHPDNDDGTTAGSVSSVNKLKNLTFLGSVIVDETAANVEMVASGAVYLPHRGFNLVAWNTSADGLTTDETENGCLITPIPIEIQ